MCFPTFTIVILTPWHSLFRRRIKNLTPCDMDFFLLHRSSTSETGSSKQIRKNFETKELSFQKGLFFFLNSKKDELCKFLDILDQHSTNILSGDSDDSTGWWIWCFHYIATVGSCPKCLQRTYQVSWVLRQLLNSNEVENGRLPKKHNGKTDANSCLAWGELVVV